PLQEHGIALGIVSNISLPEVSVQMDCGDVIVLYTDGVTEAFEQNGEQEFGMTRLTQVVEEHAGGTCQELTNHILNAVAEFTEGAPQFDDLTLVVVKREP